jgi:DNA-binding CsgD family transcriptional regulator
MNMTNDDIRALLGINIESVRTHKYRLKKKLFLSKEKSVRSFLQTVN